MVSEPFVGKINSDERTRYLYRCRDIVSSKEKIWVCKIVFTKRLTHRNVYPCPTKDMPCINQGNLKLFSSWSLGWCNVISLVGHGETFRWVKRVVKTILHTQIFSFDDRTSLRRNEGSQRSNCHFGPVLDLDFCMPKHFQPCIVRGCHGYRCVRKHRISHTDFILDLYRRILTMMTTKNRVGSLFREERKKRGLNINSFFLWF